MLRLEGERVSCKVRDARDAAGVGEERHVHLRGPAPRGDDDVLARNIHNLSRLPFRAIRILDAEARRAVRARCVLLLLVPHERRRERGLVQRHPCSETLFEKELTQLFRVPVQSKHEQITRTSHMCSEDE